MKRALCTECGSYVTLDDEGLCPQRHPLPSYRNITELAADGSPIAAPATTPPPAPTPTAAAPSATPAFVAPAAIPSPVAAPAAAGRDRDWPLIIAWTAAAISLTAAAITVAWALPDILDGREFATASAETSATASASATKTANAATPGSTGSGSSAGGKGSVKPAASKSAPKPVNLAPNEQQKQWALAVSAVLTQMNEERHDSLAGVSDTPENKQMAKQVLANAWGITNREELLATLKSLDEGGGHRAQFAEISKALASATPAQIAQLKERVSADPGATAQLAVVERYGPELGPKSIAAWDYGRYVFLCRRGYFLGWLSEKEAWERIMPIAGKTQATFSSWDEMGSNYVLGRQFWMASPEPDPQWAAAAQSLSTSGSSPWNQIPWDLDLSAK